MTFQRDLAWRQLDLLYRSSIAHQLARYALAMDYSDLPESVVHQAKRCVIDALGCAIGGYEAPGRAICEKTAKELGGTEEATVFCSGMRTSATNASFINAFLVRFLDFSDLGGGGHNSDALASILAVAEREKSNGKNFLTSLVISYEIGDRFREALTGSVDINGWTTDIRAGLNQPPAMGKLMGMTEDQIANAIGICMSHALPLGILDADKDENFMAKNTRFGWAAHDAIISCILAKNGFTGPVRIMESDSGIAKVILNGEMDFERFVDFSGWRILKTRFKILPLNGKSHGHVLSTLAIVNEHEIKPEEVESVLIIAPPKESRHTTYVAKKYPRTAENADHSLFYANALAIKERSFGVSSIDSEKFTDPVVQGLIEKITVKADPTLARRGGGCVITMKDGRRFEKRTETPHGQGDDPLTDKEVEEKFSGLASKYMSKDQIRKILDTCWSLEKVDNTGSLAKMMVFAR